MYIPHTPTHEYDDIIDLPHHVSPTRKPMSMHDRAAQFAPFSALTGYDAVIEETERVTEQQNELDDDRKAILDNRLQALLAHIHTHPCVTVTWFRPDDRKSGGARLTHTACLQKIDPYARLLLFEDGTVVPMDRLLELEIL